jgi:hypothetical protein
VGDVERHERVEALGGVEHHQVADEAAPIVADQQHTLELKRVHQGDHVTRDLTFEPAVRWRR